MNHSSYQSLWLLIKLLLFSSCQAKNKLPRNQQQAMFRKEQAQDDQDADQDFKEAADNNPENKFQNEIWHKDGGVSLMVPKVPEVAISPTSANHVGHSSNLADNPLVVAKEPDNQDLYLQIKNQQGSLSSSPDYGQENINNQPSLKPATLGDDVKLSPRPSTADSEEPTSDTSTLPDNSSS